MAWGILARYSMEFSFSTCTSFSVTRNSVVIELDTYCVVRN